MLADWFFYVGITFGALLPIANPLSTAPVFIALTQDFSTRRRALQARMSGVYMACILLVSLFAGALILSFFGITLPILRMAGGLVIAKVGFGMLEPAKAPMTEHVNESEDFNDVAFTPIAMPMLSGPGSIALTIAMATQTSGFVSYTAVATGIVLVALVSWVTLHYSGQILGFFGKTGMNALTRIMGLLLVCVGIQFIATGFLEGLTGDRVTEILRDWLVTLGQPE